MGYLGTKPANSPLTSELIPNSIITNAKINDVAATKLTGTLPDANAPSGSVIQVVSAAKTDSFTTTGTTFVDVTGLSVTITPSSASSRILIIAGVSLGALAGLYAVLPRLARNGTGIFVNDAAGSRIRAAAMFEVGNAATFPVAINFLDSPNTTSATTYSIQIMSNTSGQPARVNASANDTDSSLWSRSVSSITALEIAI